MKTKFLFLFLCCLILFSCDGSGSGDSGNNGKGTANDTVPVLLKNNISRRVNYTIIDENADVYKEGFLTGSEEQIIKSYKKGNYKMGYVVKSWSGVMVEDYAINKQSTIGIFGESYPWEFKNGDFAKL